MRGKGRFNKLEHFPIAGILLKGNASDGKRFGRLEVSECTIEKRVEIKEEAKKEEIRSWQVKCLGCGRMRPRLARCVYCGWDNDSSAQIMDEIVLTIDGKVYRSSDKEMPHHIRLLMAEIRRKGNTPEVIDAWMKRYNAEKELKAGLADNEISRLKGEVVRRALIVIGIIALIVFTIIIRMH
ncbi:MAG: hypothetical protein WCY23_06195 [Candidatus Omnitrophota bacterium]